jgi:hypothetical protein
VQMGQSPLGGWYITVSSRQLNSSSREGLCSFKKWHNNLFQSLPKTSAINLLGQIIMYWIFTATRVISCGMWCKHNTVFSFICGVCGDSHQLALDGSNRFDSYI